MISGVIFNIQRFSVHDGPGIRTVIFMSGCPLRCQWCDNPESQKTEPLLAFIEERCKADECKKQCRDVCPVGAIKVFNKKAVVDHEKCESCGQCVNVCSYDALRVVGEVMTIEEVVEAISKDTSFFRNSGGGVTLSGGEPTIQHEFCCELLKQCKETLLHTAMETCGYVDWKNLRKVVRYCDLVFYDIKHMDSVRHRLLTGVHNKVILQNAERVLSMKAKPVIIRIPVIPGLNDSEENIRDTAKFVSNSGGKVIELLPYHRLGVHKYKQYGMKYKLNAVSSPTSERIEKLRKIVESYGLKEMSNVG